MPQGPTIRQRNPLLTLLFVILGILILAYIASLVFNKSFFGFNNKGQAPKLNVKQTEVETSKLPQGFPAEIPLEQGAVITQNYNATTSGSGGTSTFQATRVFESKKTVDANYTLYNDFFSKNGWVIKTTFSDQDARSITAQKSNILVTVHISKNSGSGVVTVNITASPAPGVSGS